GFELDRIGVGEIAAAFDGFDPVVAVARMSTWRDFDNQSVVAPAPAAQETLVDAAIGGAAYVAPVACPHLDGFQRRDVLNVCFPCAQGSDKFRFRQQAHLRNRAGGVTTANADALARAGPTAGSQRHDIDA